MRPVTPYCKDIWSLPSKRAARSLCLEGEWTRCYYRKQGFSRDLVNQQCLGTLAWSRLVGNWIHFGYSGITLSDAISDAISSSRVANTDAFDCGGRANRLPRYERCGLPLMEADIFVAFTTQRCDQHCMLRIFADLKLAQPQLTVNIISMTGWCHNKSEFIGFAHLEQ